MHGGRARTHIANATMHAYKAVQDLFHVRNLYATGTLECMRDALAIPRCVQTRRCQPELQMFRSRC
eukprot:8426783-Alexandrium_andersonii.AAC.1